MTDLVYSTEVIDRNDLMLLKDFALGFLRNNTYCAKFQDLLLCITLCQGAANHYAICQGYAKRYFDSTKIGVKDFDIWFFFRKRREESLTPVGLKKKIWVTQNLEETQVMLASEVGEWIS